MIAFQVQVNDEPVVKAGAEGTAVLAAAVTYVAERKELELRVGGMTRESEGASHVDWLVRDLAVGDILTLTVVDTSEVSAPIRVEPRDPQFEEQQMREYYERLKKRFEP